ncbi:ClpP/crotonase-like domain-containing protein [Xylariaceae sp. FL0255]|nr:ClpP/crotonase-like domain-containing protein [Xylariaceae sp. FL0255]
MPSFLARVFSLACAVAAVLGSTITTTKITLHPPFNFINNDWLGDFISLVDDVAADQMSRAFSSTLVPITIASIRGITRRGGVEFAASLDIRFSSKEKAILGQPEVGTGAFPGGGGLRILSGLAVAGRWRINRAIPDAESDSFIDKFAHRVASWDSYAIAHAKSIVNGYGYPTAEEVESNFDGFGAALEQEAVPARVQAMVDAGFETNVRFEIDLNTEITLFTGPGPWSAYRWGEDGNDEGQNVVIENWTSAG